MKTPATGISWMLLLSLLLGAAPTASVPDKELPALTADLSGSDAIAQAKAAGRLVELGDSAVPALMALVRSSPSLAPRMLAVEALGHIGTTTANDALIELLPAEKNLAVRGQICMQLGYNREKRAVAVILPWLKTIGPRAIDDVKGPKESQPSTCYLRHVEALGMIGDEQAIAPLQEFAARIPPGIGFGGFLSNFVKGGVDEAIEEIRQQSAFWKAVGKTAGLEAKIAPLFVHFRRDPVARFRLHESQVVRHTDQAKVILQRLTTHQDATLAAAATALLANWDALAN